MDIWEQSQTVDPEVKAYVTSLVHAVGGSSTYDNTYSVGDDAVAVLKDLQRWLRLYDEKTNRLDVKRCLAEANLVKGDLLEILALWPENATEHKLKSKLALACLELLVPLTWPIALENETATVNHHRHVPYLQLAQVGYKRAILHHEYAKILRIAVRIGLPAMAQPKRERTRRDEGIIKLVMYFFRNVAMITQPQHLPSQGDENEITRSATIETFSLQNVFDLLLTVGSSAGDEFVEQDVILLEILFHLLKGVDAKKLFMKKEQVSKEETSELQLLMQKEKAMLNSYKKYAPTRHNRFGTMLWVRRDDAKLSTVSGQTTIANESVTLHQLDSSKKWNKPQYRGKLAQEFDEHSDFGTRTDLTEGARKCLRQFVEDFLDSSFNPLFSSLRKAIEREADRVQDTTHPKQYFFLISWFLQAETARRNHLRTQNAEATTQSNPGENMFAYIAAVLDQETFVLLNRQMQSAIDNKEWQDLQASLLCFTQILLTVQQMVESKDEEDQEIAENIQNRIFYEESTHDRIIQILRGYSHQGFAYLDAVTESVHVFVSMLERYSKQNVDLQIRSKRRARKKQKEQQVAGENGEDQNEEDVPLDDEQEAHRAVSERKFDFARFSSKLLTQPCVNTFLSLMHFYRDLSPIQLKRCHRFLYRLAFKHEMAILLCRVDTLLLLYKMIKGPEGLDPAAEGFKEWEQLVQQVFRRCIKWMQRGSEGEGWTEAAAVEMLFSKIPGTLFYLQKGYDKVVEKKAPRPPAELEIKSSVPEEQRIAVAVSMMIELANVDALSWVKKGLESAIEERQAWEDEQALRSSLPENEDGAIQSLERPSPPSIFFTPDSDERKLSLFKDKHLRLLLTTLGFERLGLAEDVDASWIIPTDLSASKLQEALQQIQKAEFDPPTFENNQSASNLVRPKSSNRRGAVFSDTESGSGSDGDVDEAAFPPNMREKRRKRDNGGEAEPPKKRRRRNREEATEEELQERARARQQKEKEKNAKIKSRLFVTDSDEESDQEGDAEFFRLEAERRKKMDGVIREALMKEKEGSGVKSKAKGKKKSKRSDSDEDRAIADMVTDEDVDDAVPPRVDISDRNTSSEDNDDDESNSSFGGLQDGEEDTPSTSPTAVDSHLPVLPLKEVSGNAMPRIEEHGDEEDEMPLNKPTARGRNVRAGFIIDSDSE